MYDKEDAMITFEEEKRFPARIGVMGIGGAGINVVNRIVESSIPGVEIIAADSDLSGLQKSKAPVKFEIGIRSRKGLNCVGNPQLGQDAALEEAERIMELLKDLDMVFFVGGEGGGTFTGAGPIFAGIASQMGILTIAIVTMPFDIQGRERRQKAEHGMHNLKDAADAILVVECDSLFQFLDNEISLDKSLYYMNDVICQAVLGILEIALKPGVISLEIDDLRAILRHSGLVLLGTGIGEGPDRAVRATQLAIANPLIGEARISGAKTVILNIVGGRDSLKLHDTQAAADCVREKGSFEQVIVGAMYDENMGDRLRVTVIASDVNGSEVLPEEEITSPGITEFPVKAFNPTEKKDDVKDTGPETYWARVDRPAYERYRPGKQERPAVRNGKFNKGQSVPRV